MDPGQHGQVILARHQRPGQQGVCVAAPLAPGQRFPAARFGLIEIPVREMNSPARDPQFRYRPAGKAGYRTQELPHAWHPSKKEVRAIKGIIAGVQRSDIVTPA
jgi:hypothetical protein